MLRFTVSTIPVPLNVAGYGGAQLAIANTDPSHSADLGDSMVAPRGDRLPPWRRGQQ